MQVVYYVPVDIGRASEFCYFRLACKVRFYVTITLKQTRRVFFVIAILIILIILYSFAVIRIWKYCLSNRPLRVKVIYCFQRYQWPWVLFTRILLNVKLLFILFMSWNIFKFLCGDSTNARRWYVVVLVGELFKRALPVFSDIVYLLIVISLELGSFGVLFWMLACEIKCSALIWIGEDNRR